MLACKISTLEFIKSRPRKSSHSHIQTFARLLPDFCFAETIIAQPIVIMGNAMREILNDQNQIQEISREVKVVPILAPIRTQIALYNPITPAHTNAIMIIVTRLLLWRRAVRSVPTVIDSTEVSV